MTTTKFPTRLHRCLHLQFLMSSTFIFSSYCNTEVSLSALPFFDAITLDTTVTVVRRRDGHRLDCFSAKRQNNEYYKETIFDFCYPNIIIAGFPKCGSSYLFSVLSQYPNVVSTKRKELCLGGPKSESWAKLLEFYPNNSRSYDSSYILSGCMHNGALLETASLLQIRKTKYLFVVRDVANMLWAAYNYWCIQEVDKRCTPGQRTNVESKRSPELFHDRILAGKTMGGGIDLRKDGRCFSPHLKQILQHVGRDNVVVLKSEYFLPSQPSAVRRRALRDTFQKLKWDYHLNTQVFAVFEKSILQSNDLVNAGYSIELRGEFIKSKIINKTIQNIYEASHFKPMLEVTRNYIHELWKKEKQWLLKKFDINYFY